MTMLRHYGPVAIAGLVIAVTLAFLYREFAWGPWGQLGAFTVGAALVLCLHFWLEDNGYLDRG